MKILQLHVDFIEYRPIRKEVQDAEDVSSKSVREEELLVLFTAIEQGDDPAIVSKAIDELKKFSEKLNVKKILIYPFAHLSQKLAEPNNALSLLKEMEDL